MSFCNHINNVSSFDEEMNRKNIMLCDICEDDKFCIIIDSNSTSFKLLNYEIV